MNKLTLYCVLLCLSSYRKTGFLLDRLNLLSRYGVVSQEELEIGIRDGRISEHPAWEDLIAVENIESESEKINGYLENL